MLLFNAHNVRVKPVTMYFETSPTIHTFLSLLGYLMFILYAWVVLHCLLTLWASNN